MTLTQSSTASELSARFLRLIEPEPAVRRLWFRIDRGDLELWLLTAPAEPATERLLYEAGGRLQAETPAVPLVLHILNPRFYEEGTDLIALVPPGAEEIFPRRPR